MIYEFGNGEFRVGLMLVNDRPSVVIDRMPPGVVGESGKPIAKEHSFALGERKLEPGETVLSFEDLDTAVAVFDAMMRRDALGK